MNLSDFRKNVEISNTILRVTKKSVKITEMISRNLVGSFDSTNFNSGSSREKSEEKKQELREEYKRQYESKRQTKISDLAECNEFKTMITLTFEPKDNQTEEQVKYNWKLAKQRLEYRFGKFKYICSLERGKDEITKKNTGHLHLHIITDIAKINNHSEYWNNKDGSQTKNKNWAEGAILDLIMNTSNRSRELKDKRIELYNDGASYAKVLLGFGHVHIKSINEHDVKYITKYATKDKDLNLMYKRTVWTSKGLEKPVKIYNNDVIDMFLELLPIKDYEKKEVIILAKMGDEVHECMRVTTFSCDDITNFYYMCQKGAYGYNLYLSEVEYDRKKMMSVMYPRKEVTRDFNFYNEIYDERRF